MTVLLLLLLAIAESERPAMTIDVVARTPADHAGEDRARATANVHRSVPRADDTSVTDTLAREVPGLHVSDAQHNPLQADISYRGFTLSPLLGTAQGLSVYLDGVRLNEPFGDTVTWGFVPMTALERLDLLPGANPVFGLNTLGGSIVLRTRSATAAEQRLDLSGGSFGSAHGAAVVGGTTGRWNSFMTVDHLTERGWREHSPSHATRGFGSFGWAGAEILADLRLAAAVSELTGNGPAPVELLALDRRAVFTHPDTTESTNFLASSRLTRMLSPQSMLQGMAYLRTISTRTLNGDDSPFEPCDTSPEILCADGAEPVLDLGGRPVPTLEAVNNRSRSRQQAGGLALERDWTRGAHQLLAGGTVDVARSRFRLGVELAEFDDSRGTVGSGVEVRNGRVDLRSDLMTAALFAADRISLSPDLDVTFAARYNHVRVTLDDQIGHELDGRHHFGHLNASAGVVRSLGRAATLFGNVSRSTRVPTPVELTCADPEAPCRLPNAFVSDPPLEPVRTTSVEAGVRGGTRLQWSAALFHATNSDDILFVSSGRARGEGHFENVGRTVRRGIEIGGGNSVWHASYAFVDAVFGDAFTVASAHHPDAGEDGEIPVRGGDRIPMTPRHVIKAGATLRYRRGSVAVDARHVSSQFVRGDEANLAKPIASYGTVDLRADHRLSRYVSMFASVENVLDARYSTFGLFGDPEDVLGDGFDDPLFVSPGAPRSFQFGIRLTLQADQPIAR